MSSHLVSLQKFLTLLDKQKMVVQVVNIKDGEGLDWLLVIAFSYEELFGDVIRVTNTANIIAGVLSAVAFVVGMTCAVAIGLCVALPLCAVARKLNRIANIDFTDDEDASVSSLYEFQQMQESLKHMKTGLSQFKNFVPRRLLRSIGVHKLANVTLGLCTEKSYTLMIGTIMNASNIRNIQDTKDKLFEFVNGFYECVELHVRKHDGMVAKYVEIEYSYQHCRHFGLGGFIAMFEVPKDAVKAGESLHKEMKGKWNTVRLGLCLHSDMITAGTVGAGEFYELGLISDGRTYLICAYNNVVNIGNWMTTLAFQYNANFLISHSLLPHATNARLVDAYTLNNFVNNSSISIYQIVMDADLLKITPVYNTAMKLMTQSKFAILEAKELLFSAAKQFPEDKLIQEKLNNCKFTEQMNDRFMTEMNVQLALNNQVMARSFETYCKSEHCHENLEAWKLINCYKQTNDLGVYHLLLKEYVSMSGSKPLNITNSAREKVEEGATGLETLQTDLELLLVDAFKVFHQL